MGCCNKKKNINLSKINNLDIRYNLDRELNGNRQVLFKGYWGKLVYFFILLIVAISPIPNLVAIYFFYLAVFSGKKKKTNEEDVKINKDTNNS